MTHKKTSLLVLSLALCLIFLGLHASPPSHALAQGVVTPAANTLFVVGVDALNLRSGPGTDKTVSAQLLRGTEVRLLNNTGDNLWSQVQTSDGRQGWVYSQYLLPQGQNSAVVGVSQLRLRAGPNINSLTLKTLEQGQALEVTGRSTDNTWLEVRLSDGSGGWVSSPYVFSAQPIAGLPIREAVGGPVGSSSETTTSTAQALSVSIAKNQATLKLANFPANKTVLVTLNGNGGHRLVVGSVTTDSQGAGRLFFTLPGAWPGGAALTEQTLTLTAAGGTFSSSASLSYYH